MTDREKLIELLRVQVYPHLEADPYEVIADYLIANGVTVQDSKGVEIDPFKKWIPVTERLPERFTTVLATDGRKCYVASESLFYKTNDGVIRIPANYGAGAAISHWMPLPEPPKGE